MNKTFGTFSKSLKKDAYLDSIKAHFLLMPSYRRYPRDEEFRRSLMVRDLYNFPRRTYWLRRLENNDRKERVTLDDYSIEHILPQNVNLSIEWQRELGPQWRRVQEQWLHTLGNLTLTGYNAEYSDRPFSEKRDMKGGFAESPLKLNAGLASLTEWNESTIETRAESLADLAVLVWSSPSLPDEQLSRYRPSPGLDKETYSIQDHPYLLAPAMRPLYEALRREVLLIDPCVTEDFRKMYVTYKAEETVVDVYPQKNRLRLILNIPYPDVSDPRGCCRDRTGSRLNGDVEVGVNSVVDLPYVMSLVRQAYERQMGEE